VGGTVSHGWTYILPQLRLLPIRGDDCGTGISFAPNFALHAQGHQEQHHDGQRMVCPLLAQGQ